MKKMWEHLTLSKRNLLLLGQWFHLRMDKVAVMWLKERLTWNQPIRDCWQQQTMLVKSIKFKRFIRQVRPNLRLAIYLNQKTLLH